MMMELNPNSREMDFAAQFANAIAQMVDISRAAPEVPLNIWEQTTRLAADYIAGYRLLAAHQDSLIAFVGGGACPLSSTNKQHRHWREMMSELGYQLARKGYVVVTGGAPPDSLMSEVILGARRQPGAKTVCLDISIPHGEGTGLVEGTPFHRFASLDPREAVAWSCADYLAFGPGGFGTRAEIFRAATFTQLRHKVHVPIHLVCPDFWALEMEHLRMTRDTGLLRQKYLDMLHFTKFRTARGIRQHVVEVTRKIERRQQNEPKVLRLPMADLPQPLSTIA